MSNLSEIGGSSIQRDVNILTNLKLVSKETGANTGAVEKAVIDSQTDVDLTSLISNSFDNPTSK